MPDLHNTMANRPSHFILLLVGLGVLPIPASSQVISTHTTAVYIHEGFDGVGIPTGWNTLRIAGSIAMWSITQTGTNPPIPPYAGSGQAKFNSYDASVGEQARLTTPRVDLSIATSPFLSFFMYHESEFLSSLDSVYVDVSTADSIIGPWSTVHGVRRPSTLEGWKKEVVPLLGYAGNNRVFLSLRGVSKYGNNIFVDEFRIADSSFHDIGAIGLIDPPPQAVQNAGLFDLTSSRDHSREKELETPRITMASSSQPVEFGAIVHNFGTFQESSYSVQWRVGNHIQPAVLNSVPLLQNSRDTLSLLWQTPSEGLHQITAWTILQSDSNRANDTARASIYVLDSSVVFFESFNGGTFPPPGWFVINRDGGALSPWFPGADTSAFLPFEGRGYAANNFQRSNGTYLDDYLITPEITGMGQPGLLDSLVFRVRSVFYPPPSQNYPDSLMILASAGGTDTSSFTTFVDYFEVPKSGWTRKGYRLTGLVPGPSVRFAFRYLHFNGGPSGSSSDFVGIDAVQIRRDASTAIGSISEASGSFSLEQNYPNPFNPKTRIIFRIQDAGFATLRVFDLLGREVAMLVNGEMEAGRYEVTFDGSGMAGGVYFYQVSSRGLTQTRHMVLIK